MPHTHTQTHNQANECTQYHHNLFHKDPIQYYTSIYLQVSHFYTCLTYVFALYSCTSVTKLQNAVFFSVEYLPEDCQKRPKHARGLLYDYTFVYNCCAGAGINTVQITVCLQIIKLAITTSSFLHHPISTLYRVNRVKYSSHHPVLLS